MGTALLYSLHMRILTWILAFGLMASGCDGGTQEDGGDLPADPDGIEGEADPADVPRDDIGEVPADDGLPDGRPDVPVDDTGEDVPPAPSVTFLSPSDGETLPNPVLFTIEARGVEEVEIFADETYSLGPAWDPAERSTLLYRFSGTGIPRPIRVTGRVGGTDVARDDITITVTPDACEDLFFVTNFDSRNDDLSGSIDVAKAREDALTAVKDAVEELRTCGDAVTLGGMMALLLYEGGFHIAFYNTICEQNSYVTWLDTDCDVVAEALYSYQYGIGGFHTSNLHACKGGAYTEGMRSRFLLEAADAGYRTDDGLLTPAILDRFETVCPGDSASAVDYYILAAHDDFGVPKDDSGNYPEGFGTYPFFDVAVSIGMTFGEIMASCAVIDDDRDAITAFGGGDPSYAATAKQDEILSLWWNYRDANCP